MQGHYLRETKPLPFDFAQGRPCRTNRDKGGHPNAEGRILRANCKVVAEASNLYFTITLLGAQRLYWVDGSRSPRRNVTGERSGGA